jgi:hypothetical protein
VYALVRLYIRLEIRILDHLIERLDLREGQEG